MAKPEERDLIYAMTPLDVIHYGEEKGLLEPVPVFLGGSGPAVIRLKTLKGVGFLDTTVTATPESPEGRSFLCVDVYGHGTAEPRYLVALGIGWGPDYERGINTENSLYFAAVRREGDDRNYHASFTEIFRKFPVNTLYIPTNYWPLELLKGRVLLEHLSRFAENWGWDPDELHSNPDVPEEAKLTIQDALNRLSRPQIPIE